MNRSWCARTLSVILLAALQACGGGGSPATLRVDAAGISVTGQVDPF